MSKALARTDQLKNSFSLIHPPDDEIRGLNYYRDELEDTLKRFENFKLKTNMIIERGKQQEYLIQFRQMLSGHCITHNRIFTIIQCTTTIKHNNCKFYEQCETRKRILKLIEI